MSSSASVLRLAAAPPSRAWEDFAPLPDGPARRWRATTSSRAKLPAALLGLFATLLAGSASLHAGDLLRGGAPAGAAGKTNRNGVTSAEAARARANAQDALARTTNAIKSVKGMQEAARQMAAGRDNLGANPNQPGQLLPNVPNGLVPGGLEVAPGVGVDPTLWHGAALPREVGNGTSEVLIKQTAAQAVLNWKTFNVGRRTTVLFDQDEGGAQKGQWIAFNKVSDPSGVPSQILGQIKAGGQVYIVNPNGIIFGGESQINLRTLVASSLPINDNLVQQGLLNNRDAQFLFSSLSVPGGSDGTPAFNPITPPTPTGRPGDVVVQPGAQLNSEAGGDGNGGRIMLVGPNVRNEGTISTPAGQTILAAGLQVGIAAHAGDDPSLRGLDVWVGDVADYAGTSTNSGLIDIPTGSAWMAGRYVNQLGVINSTSSVNLNGRIDLRASYGAVANPNFDNSGTSGFGGPAFVYQKTGVVTMGSQSATLILPDYTSKKAVPGTALPETSQINIEGLGVHMKRGAMILAPNGDVSIRAGVWPYTDADGNRTTLLPSGQEEPGLNNFFANAGQKFYFSGGQIYLDPDSFINVAGSTDVFVPLSHSILNVEFRGSEFADSPVQRNGLLRATPLTVDIRRTGVSNGRYWVGTPLGDVTGLAGLVERDAAQLTAVGGNINLQAGGSIVVGNGATLNVSGGFYNHASGMVKTTRLRQYGRLVDIHNAQPGQVYDGVYTGTYTRSSARWGVSETFTVPWMTGERYEQGYTQGANGGTLNMTAASMAVDGQLLGLTVNPPRGRGSAPSHSSLSISFKAEKTFVAGTNTSFISFSPTPPAVTFGSPQGSNSVPSFALAGDVPVAIPASRQAAIILSPELLTEDGFGNLTVENPDGNVTVPKEIHLAAPALGSVSLTGANVTVDGKVSAPGGKLSFRAATISPTFTAEFPLVNPPGGALSPAPNAPRGLFTLGTGASLSAAGLLIDDRPGSPAPLSKPLVIDGGSITIESFSAELLAESVLDVSGGVVAGARGSITYGNGGSITIRTGKDPGFPTVLGGHLTLQSTLAGFSGKKGGALSIQASLIQIGGTASYPNTLLLAPDFFRQGGFTSYSLEGIGAASSLPAAPGQPTPYAPGISIAPGTRIELVAENLLAVPNQSGRREISMVRVLKEAGLRSPVSLSLSAVGSDDSFTSDILEVRGDLVMGRDAQILADPGASISLRGQTATVLGSISAPGGTISITGASRFPVPPDNAGFALVALPTVHIGPQSVLSAIGVPVFTPDSYGRRQGTLRAGGTISVSGNIVASAGAVLDVSGASAIFDIHPTSLGDVGAPNVPSNSGLNSPLWRLRSVPMRIDSNGGTISLQGSTMLFSDATLLGRAGGPTAVGGTLSVSSGRFYPTGVSRTTADINLLVKQSGNTLASTNASPGVGRAILDDAGVPLPGMGYFAVDRFTNGGFDSLDLGYRVNTDGTIAAHNVQFQGPVSISAKGNLRVASGGVIWTDSTVHLTAKYIALGQAFRPPINPQDSVPLFTQDPANPSQIYNFAPTFGPGQLNVTAELIDIGTLSLQNTGRARFSAVNGDIRGNGTLQIAGDLVMQAGQIYPTTLSTFNIFAYDHAGTPGSVTILGAGTRSAPLSAGGSLNIFASQISQGGVLRAPLGSITIGWDGTDFDPTDADLDPPPNPIAGTTATVPVAQQVTLRSGSETSVAAWSGTTGTEMLIPFGLSPDGTSWVAPNGVNVTTSGLPAKGVSLAGNSVTTEAGSTVDLRGGGDLYAFRWKSGTGGSADLLGTASVAWAAGTVYQAGDLVTFGSQTWTARVRHSGQTPASSQFWTPVAESYAVLPDFPSEFAPYAPFNTGTNARLLEGNSGYVSSSLKIGDRIYLERVDGLRAGTYTLLPRRYALLPGAYLITPTTNATYGTYTVPEGATSVAGYRLNEFNQPKEDATIRTQFEVAPTSVIRGRAAFDDYFGNAFFSEAAQRFDVVRMQQLPRDAGYLGISGNTALRLNGRVLSDHTTKGRGATIDISSLADMYVIGGTGTAPVGAAVVLDSTILNSWGADSLFIGGTRRRTADGTVVTVRTNQIVVNNPGAALAAPEVILASKSALTIAPGSAVISRGELLEDAEDLLISGDGTLVRVSSNINGDLIRTNTTASIMPLLTVGAGARLAGTGVTLDSTYGTNLSPTADIAAFALNLGSGQISIDLRPGGGALTGSVVPQHLVLADQLLADAQNVNALTLRSYGTIDVYGNGTFGSPTLRTLAFLGGGLRGYDQGAGTALFQVGEVLFSNPSNVAALAAPALPTGTLQIDSTTTRFGTNSFSVAGYQDVVLKASGGVLSEGIGTFTTPSNLTIRTPLITGAGRSNRSITAGGALLLDALPGEPSVTAGLGASYNFRGASVAANTRILLPSGQLSLRSTGAGQDVTVGGQLDTAGVAQDFYDVTRYSPGGDITLTSDTGDVLLTAGSLVSVAAPAGGGDAGTVKITAAAGVFGINGATLLGNAAAGQISGSFILDAGSVPAFDDVSAALNGGGFFEQRNIRVRTGDIAINNAGGLANVARNFSVSADTGNLLVNGTIDASGTTGGKIVLATGRNLTLATGSILTVHAREFSSAGKGGEIRLEAGAAVNGVASPTATLDLQAGSTIDLGVDAFVAGDFTTPGSSAFFGQFSGTLHLRAPRNGNDVQVNKLLGNITGASSVMVEGYRLYDQASGLLNNALRDQINTDATNYMNAGYAAMFTKLATGTPNDAGLSSVIVIAPGAEVFRNGGDLTLGTAVSGLNTEDWNLANFRYGPKLAPGILTLRTTGDLVFNNTLSDGFTAVAANAASGNSTMWLAQLANVVTANGLPVNTQSWSYRLVAGADLSAADFRAVRPTETLAAGKGSILVGEFYPEIPNSANSGATPGTGSAGITANTIRITTGAANRTRYEVIRTGTGDIDIAAGRDVQLRNQFATIYTAGVRLPTPTTIFAAGDFVRPIVERTGGTHPNQGFLGAPQQVYTTQWSLAGGDVTISAGADIGRFTLYGGQLRPDTSRQLPTNWLYRRGFVDPATGLFTQGGVGVSGSNGGVNVSDAAASTTWWIDFSNFFQGIGALGGGDIALRAGSDVINADAVIPTNARMPGRDLGVNIAPDASKLHELGGGNLTIRAGDNIDGGIYYVERGQGRLFAGGSITTNSARSPSVGILGTSGLNPAIIESATPAIYNPATWLPTTLFVGKSNFDVSARGDVLLGPVTNAFLLPQSINNKFWYKTYFNTFSSEAGATVSSFGGSVTHRLAATLPGESSPRPILEAWLLNQNLFTDITSRASFFQPWIRLAETDISNFSTQLTVAAPNLRSTAFAGDINVVGSLNLFPSPTGTIELAASGSLVGLQPSGRSIVNDRAVTVWTSATINLSDANPAAAPSIATPLAYATLAGRTLTVLRESSIDPFGAVDLLYTETGAFTGQAASIVIKQSLHGRSLLHASDPNPVRIYAGGGDVSGLTLFAPKATQVLAANDITDITFYIQNTKPEDISIVSAGRDITPNNPNAPLRSLANDTARGNFVGDPLRGTVTGVTTNALPGDIQINGPGVLEVLAGRNVDLGTDANLNDGTGVGITSIGNARNPNLPFEGADLIVMAGVSGDGDGGRGPAIGLSKSSLDFSSLLKDSTTGADIDSEYLKKLGTNIDLDELSEEQQAVVALELFFQQLRDTGRNFPTTGSYTGGLSAVGTVFGTGSASGEIFTRARDIRTSAGGAIALAASGGGVTMASDIFGNPLTPPGIVTEFGGSISIFTDKSVDIGQARIFTLRGGDIIIWSTSGDIAAGTAPKTVVTAPPTRVIIDATSADVKTDLGGLATGGGIGVLASVAGVQPGDVDLIAPSGVVDAGDAGIRSTGNLNIAANAVLNASNIQVGGTSSGVPSAPPVAAPNLGALGAANAAQGAQASTANEVAQQQQQAPPTEELPSIITVEVLGYGGSEE